MNKALKKTTQVSLGFIAGIMVGYALTIWSLFPTSYGNFIFAMAPDNMPYGNDSPAVSAHLVLIYDTNLLHKQSCHYELDIHDAQGKLIAGTEFSTEQAGGLFNLERHGKLKWDEDAWGVTVTIDDFNYRYEIPKKES